MLFFSKINLLDDYESPARSHKAFQRMHSTNTIVLEWPVVKTTEAGIIFILLGPNVHYRLKCYNTKKNKKKTKKQLTRIEDF